MTHEERVTANAEKRETWRRRFRDHIRRKRYEDRVNSPFEEENYLNYPANNTERPVIFYKVVLPHSHKTGVRDGI